VLWCFARQRNTCSVCSDGLAIRSGSASSSSGTLIKHRFPMRMRPGDRPPVQRFANRPLNVELLQARGSLGKLGGPPAFAGPLVGILADLQVLAKAV
jgi:hypothetical protein